jgi:hypothetical protein
MNSPIQFATQGQWWSNLATQVLHTEQCFDLSGLLTRQEEQKVDGSKPPEPCSASSIIVYKKRDRQLGKNLSEEINKFTLNLNCCDAEITPESPNQDFRKQYHKRPELLRKTQVVRIPVNGIM